MIIHEPKPDPTRAKEVKVKIPVSHHIKLHSMKVLTGKQISDAITEALDAYFASSAFERTMHPHTEQLQAIAALSDDSE
jgi:hypothetical protein